MAPREIVMGSAEKVKSLANKIPSFLARIDCETLTKTTLVEPLIQALGYDIDHPSEVLPKYASTYASTESDGRRGVDYALMQYGAPVVLIVCHWPEDDIERGRAQLATQFEATDVRLGILTNRHLQEPRFVSGTSFQRLHRLMSLSPF
jgi:hypothetical protein